VTNPPKQHKVTPARILLIAGLLASCTCSALSMQARQFQPASNENPIYIADSPIASDSLQRASELLAQDNLDEAVRLCDEIIRVHGDRLMLIDEANPDRIHIPVRTRVHDFLRKNPELLGVYRRQLTPRARVWLDQDQSWMRAANEAWLTEPGLIASLRHAQTLIEAGRFHAGIAMLEQQIEHPDAAAYRDRIETLTALANRFVGMVPENDDTPHRARALVWDNLDQTSVNLDGIVPGALAQATLTPITQLELGTTNTNMRTTGANWKPTAWSAPLVEGSHLYTNDGYTISCFDRFTLRPLWRVQTSDQDTEIPINADSRARLGRIIEDSTSVSSDGHGSIYVAAGIPRNGDQADESQLYKLDHETGSTVWSIDISTLDPSLAGASIRGPVVVDQGTIVVAARTSNRRQRLITLSLLGIDSATGSMKWLRPLASAGSLPFQQMGQLAHSPIVRDGVGYYSDLIGFAAAVRIATGEVLWARPLPPPDLYARFTRPAFAGNAPVINDHGLFMLSSDGTQIFQIEPDTGRTIATRPAAQLGESLYLLGVDNDIFVCVSNERVSYYHADRFATSSPIRSPELDGAATDSTGITGRVVLAGDHLLVPVDQGVRLLDPNKPAETTLIEINASGNIAALDGQLIVVDQMHASSFLSWETASRSLKERIEDDASAAITLTELAYRAERIDEIIPSVEHAMKIIRAQPIEQRNALRSSLFDVLHDMVREAPGDEAQPEALLTLLEQLGNDRVFVLLRSLGELARTHEQVVAHRMALGAMNERYGRSSEAINAYQDVLDQPELSRAMWEGSGIAVRAGLEASRRIGSIIERAGFSAYDPANTRARAERSLLGTNPRPEQLESLAQRYPWSSIAPSLMLEATQGYAQSARIPASIDAARSGIEIARRFDALGLQTQPTTLESLGDQLISGLLSTSRARDAYAAARSITESFPGLALRHQGRTITLKQLAQSAGQANTLPTLGTQFIDDPEPLLLTGTPLRPAHRMDPGGILLYAPQLGRLQYARVGRNIIEPVWERPAPGTQQPIAVWQGPSRTLIFWPESLDAGDTGTLEAIETTTGTVIWSLADLRLSLEQGSARVPDDIARVDTMIPIPTIGTMPIRQLVVACDGQSVVVSDRVGRALGVDLHSGQALWQRDLPVNRLHDLDLRQGQLGICGLMIVDRAQAQRDGSITPVVASIDPRTGEPGQVIERFGHMPRWVRVGDQSRLFVASTERITAIDIERGVLDWVVHDEDIAESEQAWISDARLLVLDARSNIWSIDPTDGSRSTKPIDDRGRVTPRGWLRVISEIGRTTVLSNTGIVSFDAQDQVLASDPGVGNTTIIDTAWGRTHAVQLGEARLDEQSIVSTLTMLDHTNARLLDTTELRVPALLSRTPNSIVPVNGGVIVGFGEVSVFVRTAD